MYNAGSTLGLSQKQGGILQGMSIAANMIDNVRSVFNSDFDFDG
jgi:hypothetical protein